jgi:hypothetical protein
MEPRMPMNRRPLRRLAVLRSARRRLTEIPPPEQHAAETLPELECPDDDREFVAWSPEASWGELETA